MRKTLILLILLLTLVLAGCVVPRNPVLDSLPPAAQSTLITHGFFQDYTDYGKYLYTDITEDMLEESPYFRRLETEDIPVLEAYLEDFQGWVALSADCPDCDLAQIYDFSPDMLREGDFWYLKDKSSVGHTQNHMRQFDNYDIYYFCIDTQTLYYFHSNI